MKIRKILIGTLSAVMMLGAVLTVSATELVVSSPIAPAKNMPVPYGTDITITDIEVQKGFFQYHDMKNDPARQPDVDAIRKANETASVKEFQDAVKESTLGDVQGVINALNGKTWWSTFFEVVPNDPNNLDKAMEVTMTVPGIADISVNDLSIIHFDPEKGWEVLKIIKKDGDKITVMFDGFSPAAIAVAINKSVTPVTPTPAANNNASPKTGVATHWVEFAFAAVVLAVCAAAFSRKRRA